MDFPSTVVSEGSAVFYHGLLLLLLYNIYNHYITFDIRVFLWKPDLYDSIICKIGKKVKK